MPTLTRIINLTRRSPFRACPCGCKRFRLVNPDGTDATVKVKTLKNIRRAPLAKITWESEEITKHDSYSKPRYFRVKFTTDFSEHDTLRICASCEASASQTAEKIISYGGIGLDGREIKSLKIIEE